MLFTAPARVSESVLLGLYLTVDRFLFSPRLKDVQSIDELRDVYNHFLLYYGRDIPKMQNAAKASKKKLKKIKEVSEEDGKHPFELVLFPCSRVHDVKRDSSLQVSRMLR